MGSPIIQNGAVIGAVTHAFVEDSSKGVSESFVNREVVGLSVDEVRKLKTEQSV